MNTKIALLLTWTVQVGLLFAFPFKNQKNEKLDISVLRRKTRSVSEGPIECVHMQSTPGELTFTSEGSEDVCGLYLIGMPNQIVEVEFLDFDISCDTGLLAVFDGWELNREIVPGMHDHPLPIQERYTPFCGVGPDKIFVSSQNVALIQYRILAAGEGFKVRVSFKPNPQPCNAVAMFENGALTMKNYGNRRNCTVSIIYPSKIQALNVDVGVTAERPTVEAEIGLSDKQCMNYAGGDYVQLMNGNGLDTSLMKTHRLFCGMESSSEENVKVVLGCQHSVVKMVSSGEYYNTYSFTYSLPAEDEVHETNLC